jgi:hypothetical protein
MTRELVRLRDRYPTASRMTRWRIRNEPEFPAGVDIHGTEYFYVDELDAYEESHRRLTPKRSAEADTTAENTLAPDDGNSSEAFFRSGQKIGDPPPRHLTRISAPGKGSAPNVIRTQNLLA